MTAVEVTGLLSKRYRSLVRAQSSLNTQVVVDNVNELLTAYYFAAMIIILGSYIIYGLENEKNEQFETLGDAMWWSLVTFTTVGYGGIIPSTSAGQIIGSLLAILGVAIFAFPAGVIGTGLGLQVKENEKIEKLRERRSPAAQLVIARYKLHKSVQRVKKMASPVDDYTDETQQLIQDNKEEKATRKPSLTFDL